MSTLLTPHVKAQILRFVRVSALAFLASLPLTGGKISWSSLWALGAGAFETGLRQLLPVKEIPAVTAVLADATPAAAKPTPPPVDPPPPAKG